MIARVDVDVQADEAFEGTFERFAIVPGRAAACDKLNATDLRCLVALASFANGDRKARPGVQRICEAMGLDYQNGGRGRVRRSLRRLEGEGLILRISTGGGRARAGVYQVNRPPVKGGTVRPGLGRNRGTVEHETGVRIDPKPGPTVPPQQMMTDKRRTEAAAAAAPKGTAPAAGNGNGADRGEWKPTSDELDTMWERAGLGRRCDRTAN